MIVEINLDAKHLFRLNLLVNVQNSVKLFGLWLKLKNFRLIRIFWFDVSLHKKKNHHNGCKRRVLSILKYNIRLGSKN